MRSVVVSERQSFSLFSFKWSRKHFNNSSVWVGSAGPRVPCLFVERHQVRGPPAWPLLALLAYPEFSMLWTLVATLYPLIRKWTLLLNTLQKHGRTLDTQSN